MDKLLESKECMVQTINQIIHEYSTGIQLKQSEIQKVNLDNEHLQKLCHKMTSEIQVKDKLLIQNEKTIHDYSELINNLQEKKEKELSEKEKHSMLRTQDKEIKRLTDELKVANETIQRLTNEMNSKKKPNESPIIGFSPTTSNSIIEISEITTLDLGGTTNSINEVVKEVVKEDVKEDKPVEEVVKEDKPVEEEKPVEEVVEESDEDIEVEIITHYKKEYFIITGETPQYIYTIDGDDLGDKVGEIQGKKKVFYDSPKK